MVGAVVGRPHCSDGLGVAAGRLDVRHEAPRRLHALGVHVHDHVAALPGLHPMQVRVAREQGVCGVERETGRRDRWGDELDTDRTRTIARVVVAGRILGQVERP